MYYNNNSTFDYTTYASFWLDQTNVKDNFWRVERSFEFW